MRLGSILVSFAAITLFATAFGARFYSDAVFSVLLALLLIALCVAIALHVQFLLLKRREHRETVSALDATEHQYKSVSTSRMPDRISAQRSFGSSLSSDWQIWSRQRK